MTGLRQRVWPPGFAALVLALGLAAPAGAVEGDRKGATDPRAMQVVERMSTYLARQQAFSVTIDIAYDVVQEWGQKLEFGETRAVAIRRPDRVRVDVTDRDGSQGGMLFDGKVIAVFDAEEKVYATAERPGTLDAAIAHFVDDLGMRLPLTGILRPDLAKVVAGWAHAARWVEESTIAGVPCDHVALSGPWEDVQLWVERGERPLLRRVVITYTRAEAKPQFQAQLRDWNLSPDLPDARFSFTPEPGATKIEFAPLLQRTQPGAAGGQP